MSSVMELGVRNRRRRRSERLSSTSSVGEHEEEGYQLVDNRKKKTRTDDLQENDKNVLNHLNKFKVLAPNATEAYRNISHLLETNKSLKLTARPNLKSEWIITPQDLKTFTFLKNTSAINTKELKYEEKRKKAIVVGFPFDMPKQELLKHNQIIGAERMKNKDGAPTKTMLCTFTGKIPDIVDLGEWGKYSTKTYYPEPLRCYNCQKYGHHKSACTANARCAVCSGRHNTAVCIAKHKEGIETFPRCPNCREQHPAWSRRCPVRLNKIRSALPKEREVKKGLLPTPPTTISSQALLPTPQTTTYSQALLTTPKTAISSQALLPTPQTITYSQALLPTPKTTISSQALLPTPQTTISSQAILHTPGMTNSPREQTDMEISIPQSMEQQQSKPTAHAARPKTILIGSDKIKKEGIKYTNLVLHSVGITSSKEHIEALTELLLESLIEASNSQTSSHSTSTSQATPSNYSHQTKPDHTPISPASLPPSSTALSISSSSTPSLSLPLSSSPIPSIYSASTPSNSSSSTSSSSSSTSSSSSSSTSSSSSSSTSSSSSSSTPLSSSSSTPLSSSSSTPLSSPSSTPLTSSLSTSSSSSSSISPSAPPLISSLSPPLTSSLSSPPLTSSTSSASFSLTSSTSSSSTSSSSSSSSTSSYKRNPRSHSLPRMLSKCHFSPLRNKHSNKH